MKSSGGIYHSKRERHETEQKERVLSIRWEGGGKDLFRFKSDDGKWYFFAEGSSMAFDENDIDTTISFQSEPVESIAEGIKKLISDFQIFFVLPTFVHPEYRADVKAHLENLYANLTEEESIKLQRAGDFARKPEEWLREAEWRVERNARRDEKKNKKEIDDAKPQSDKHFLLYWQERNVREHEASGYPLDVVSSRQLKRAKAGDTLWIATINHTGELILAGRLRVGEIVDYQTAIRKLNDTSLWDGGFFALPAEGEAEYLHGLNIKDVELDLRFANSEADRFVLKNGKINAQQMQTMRELSAESADLLTQIWESIEYEETGDDFKNDFNTVDEENYLAELLENCRLIVSQQPDSVYAHYNLGVALDENDLPEEAKIAYLKAIELDPNYWAAYYNLGQYYLRARELNKADQSLKNAVRLAPDFAPARFMLGVVYGEAGDFERAIAATKEGLRHAPEDPKAHFNIGNFYFHLRNYEKAVRWLEQSLELAPDEPKTFYRLGECYRHLGEKQKEFDAYLDAVELSPDFADALFALGTAYAHLIETAESRQVSYFETGGELILSDPRVSFYLGLGNLALGNVDEARESVTDLRKMDERLANDLQFFINRFNQRSEEPEVAVKTNPTETVRQKRKLIEFYINDKRFEAKNIPEMYQQALEYLVDARLLDDVSLPVASGEKRFILAREPVHPTGKPFLAPVEYQGFFMEAHNNRPAAIAQLRKLIESVGCTFGQSSEFLPKKDAFNNLKPENQPAGNDADVIRECVETEMGTDSTRIEDIMETTNTKVELNLAPSEVERLGRKPSEEDRLSDFIRAQITLLTAEERKEFGITAINEAWGAVGSPAIGDLLTVHPDDYSEQQTFKAYRLQLWKKSREEIKELLRIEIRQNELGVKL